MARGARTACHVVAYVTWVVFAVDYVLRLVLARRRGRYAVRHVPDLAMVVLPVFRPLRLLRLVLLLRLLNRQASDSFHGRVVVYVSSSATVLIFCAALAALDAERGHSGANITTFGNAIWWAFTTVTTVGYGDHFPVTVEGRAVAIGLMIGGVALIGVVTATFASWLINRVRDVAEENEVDLAALHAEIRQLRSDIAELRSAVIRPGSP